MKEQTDRRTDGRTDGRTNRQLARGPGEPSGARKRPWGARARKGLASCNYGASATPALSPIIRVRFEVRFSGPLGGQSPRESHRKASRSKRPTSLGGTEHGRKRRGRWRETTGAPTIHYVASAVRHGSIPPRFGAVSAPHASSCNRESCAIGRIPRGDHYGESWDMTAAWFSGASELWSRMRKKMRYFANVSF